MKLLRYTAIAAVLVSTLVSCGSSLESAADYVESGKGLIEEGKLEKARLEFKNAIQIDPRTAEAFYQLALLDEKSQKWKSMYANLTTTEQLNPSHYDAIVKLGQLYLLSGDFDTAGKKAKTVLDIDGNHIAALTLRASIEMKQQNYGSALEDVKQVLQLDDKNIEALTVKAMSYNQQGEHQQALKVLDHALTIEPDNLALTMIKLSILESQKDFVAVEKIYRGLRLTKPDERWVVASLAKLLNFQNRYDDAKQELQQFIDAQPEDRDAKLMLVSLVRTREPEQAITLLDSYIQQDKSDYELQFAKIKLQLDNEQTDQALVGLQAIVDNDSEGNNGRKSEMILANYEFSLGEYDAVQKKVDHVLSSEPEDEAALILKSKINILNNNIDKAVTDLRVVLRNNLESDDAMVLLGSAYIKSGSPGLAEDNFRQALSVNPGNQLAALFVADSLIKTDNVERAEAVITAALKENPTNGRLLQFLANLKLQNKDWVGAESIAETLREKEDSSATASYIEGRVLQGQQKYELAIEKYKAALAVEPSMSNALKGIAYSYFELDRKDDLMVFLKELIKDDPKDLNAYTMLYEIQANDSHWDEAILTLQSGLKAEPKWQAGYLLLATTHQRQDNSQAAIAAYESGLEALPESNAISLQLASAYERKGDFEKAKSLYEQVLERNPDVNVASNNLASLLSDQFRSDANLRKALAITEKFEKSSEPYFMDTYAWVNAQLGQLDKAQMILERVIAKSPDVAVFNYHLGAVYHKKADKASAEKYLKLAEMLAKKQGDDNLVLEVNKLLGSL
jgi:tetratricopeptide (TPR) repeat protein